MPSPTIPPASLAVPPVHITGSPELVPLAVWSCAQTSAQYQRAGRYLPVCSSHPGKMLPVLAQRLVAEYCPPGDLVLDPMCGIGTTLVEAIHLGRDAVGVELEPKWAEVARANTAHAHSARGTATVVTGDARQLRSLLDPELVGQVALVLTSPPYGSSIHGQVTAHPGQGVAKYHNTYSADPANLGRVPQPTLLEALGEILAGCYTLLRPSGAAGADRPPLPASRAAG